MEVIVTPNPPWVDRVLNKNWDAIVRRFGNTVPQYVTSKRGKITPAKEFGCGSYGCVLPTEESGVVFKVTSDPSEAAFVTAAKRLEAGEKYWPDGMIRYFDIFQVPNETHKRRPVFVLTRQEAEHVGDIGYSSLSAQQRQMEYLVLRRVTRFKAFAAIARDKIIKSTNPRRVIEETARLADWAEEAVDWAEVSRLNGGLVPVRFAGAHVAAYAIRAAKIMAEELVNADVGYMIGGALDYYLDHGMLLADVHSNNLGLVLLEDHTKPNWVITDPGHMVPLDTRWLDLEVPVL